MRSILSMSMPCQCHVKTRGETPRWLRNLFGTLFYQYTGLPVLGKRSCNSVRCRHHESWSAKFEYRFPVWLFPLIVSWSGTWIDLNGIGGGWSFRVPDLIPNLNIIQLIRGGDSLQIEQFMETHNISPRAIHPVYGDDLLSVSSTFLLHVKIFSLAYLTRIQLQ